MRLYFRIIAWVLIVGAVALLGKAGYAVYDWNQRVKVYEIAQGVVTDIVPNVDSTQLFPVISFKAIDNQKLKIKSRTSDVSAQVGDSVQVLYDLANPDDMLPVHLHPVQNNSVWVGGAALLLVAGLSILFRQWQQQNHRQMLQASGKTVQAVYDTTETFSLVGFHFYRACLVAHVTYPQEQTLKFTSEWFTEDPARYWQGKEVKVHINVGMESDYWVNSEQLPENILI